MQHEMRYWALGPGFHFLRSVSADGSGLDGLLAAGVVDVSVCGMGAKADSLWE